MDRREALRRTVGLMGGVIFMPSIAGVLSGCTPNGGGDWDPAYFSSEHARLVERLSDVIIPRTDTPGAVDAGVPSFIEEMVYTAYEESDREHFEDGLERFDARAEDSHGSPFLDLEEEAQIAFAEEENRRAIEGEAEEDPAFFLIMKELTIAGYFTSEVGAKEHLNYVKVPGRYDGCVPFEEIGTTWAV